MHYLEVNSGFNSHIHELINAMHDQSITTDVLKDLKDKQDISGMILLVSLALEFRKLLQ